MNRRPKVKQRLRSALLALSLMAGPATADIPCPAFMPGCGFSISGKSGSFLKSVDPQKLAAASTALTAAPGEGKGLAEHSINKGEFNGSGLPMPQTEKSLGEMVALLRAHWPYQDPGPIKIRMVGSTAYGPKAQPDNAIVVPLGFLERSKTDDEIAWVMAHEFSHIALRHFARSADLARRKHMTDVFVNGLLTAFALSQERAQNTGQGIHLYAINDPKVRQRSDAAWAEGQNVRLMMNLGDQAVSRIQEDQADAAGIDLALAAGFAPDDGAAHALDVVAEDDAREAAKLGSFQNQLQKTVMQSIDVKTTQTATTGNISGAGADFFGSLKKNLMLFAADKLIAYLSDSHRPTPQRRKGVVAYMAAAYPNAAGETKSAWLTAVRSTLEFEEAKKAVDAHDLALADLQAGDPKKALADLQEALKARYAHTPLIDDEAAKIYAALGDVVTADKLYEEVEHPPIVVNPRASATRAAPSRRGRGGARPAAVAESPSTHSKTADTLPQSLDGYRDHVDLLVAHGQYPKAEAKITEAKTLFGDAEAFLPAIIFIDLKTNKADEMTAAVAECLHTENEALRQQCRYAVFDDDQRAKLDSLSPAQRAKLDKTLARTDGGMDQNSWWKGVSTVGTPGAPSTTKD